MLGHEIASICALYDREKRLTSRSHLRLTVPTALDDVALQSSKPMPRAKWYSPQLRRDLVTRLYFRARAEGIPMTRLADRLIDEALSRSAIVRDEIMPQIAEEPQTTAIVPS